ncbi:hypothetical protein [Flavobacterium sp. UMI-01]|uniref:hypothetical protein n=1 Tax=Flavobacterium sp. UMI-01 TaxID=1441053 RepID=UPI001C7D7B7B|nr:hypothetical protein [Flavobacterium sp. UMI-01]
MKINIYFYCFLYCAVAFSQAKTNVTNSQKVVNLLDTYFKLDRETIHVQFNKEVYVTNEIVGFKGYVWSKNNEAPNTNTTNVNVVIYDSNNQVVKKQLLYASNGTFSGAIQLNESFKSGLYHFQFYTNWMNNFNEDYSFIQTVEIINRDEPYVIKSKTPVWSTAKITFTPESSVIIDGIYNTVGVKITDCNQKGLQVNDVVIWGSKSKEVARFNTNKVGNGYFTFIADKSETYFLKIKNENLQINEPLPAVNDTGIAISCNNNLPKNKLAIVVKTNEKGLKLFTNKKYTLLIHQNEKMVLKEFTFANNELEHTLFFDKQNISNGVNSIRLLDENLNQVTQKLFYHFRSEKITTAIHSKRTTKDSVVIYGNSDLKKANISISILPEKSLCKNEEKSILGTFYLNNFLIKPEVNNYFYFDPRNENRKQDIEALMLNQNQNKFSWDDIKSKTPKISYPFNKGVTVSGKVETNANLKSKGKLTLISTKKDVFEETVINANGNFKYENFFAQDSTVFVFQVANANGSSKYSRIEARVENNESNFIYPFKYEKAVCPTVQNQPEEKFVFNKNAIELTGLSIVLDTKKLFINKDLVSNTATGFKIDEQYGTVFDFLNEKGYSTGVDNETGDPFVKDRSGLNKGVTPAFRIDNNRISDLSELYSVFLSDVEEIYIDKHNARFMGTSSVIDIFLKKGAVRSGGYKIKHNLFMVTKGYAYAIPFKNAYFDNLKEYILFGTLNWTPSVIIDETPNYQIKFPREEQNEIQVVIEGFSEDGQLISEMQKINFRE